MYIKKEYMIKMCPHLLCTWGYVDELYLEETVYKPRPEAVEQG
jgi:hypothetical protein